MTTYGRSVNNPGGIELSAIDIPHKNVIKTGIVIDIVLNEDHPRYAENGGNIGEARIRLTLENENMSNQTLNWMYPEETSIQQYPLLGEMVNVKYLGGRLFYSRRLNITNRLTTDYSEIIVQTVSPDTNTTIVTNDEIGLAATGVPVGDTIQARAEKYQSSIIFPTTYFVRPCEGDMTFQGRFGNVIRMGSSLFSNPTRTVPSANLLLTAGLNVTLNEFTTKTPSERSLTYEDINRDASSIWMVTDEIIDFHAATENALAHLRGTEIPKEMPYYTGAQIFINSDRLILNSKVNEIALFSKTEINLSALGSITVSSEKNLFLTSGFDIHLTSDEDVLVRGRNISLISTTGDISNNAQGTYSILGKKIFIGSGGDINQPLVLGGTLSLFLQRLIQTLVSTLTTAVGASASGPVTIEFPQALQLTALSDSELGGPTPAAASFNSRDNFTAKVNRV